MRNLSRLYLWMVMVLFCGMFSAGSAQAAIVGGTIAIEGTSSDPYSMYLTYDYKGIELVDHYVIKRPGLPDLNPAPRGSFTDVRLTPNTAYTYTVEAYDVLGFRLASSTKTISTQPLRVTVNAQVLSKTSANLTYSTEGTVSHYVVKRNDGKVFDPVPASGLTDDSLVPNTAYSYLVQAYDRDNHLVGSQSANVTTAALSLDATAKTIGSSSIEITMNPDGDVDHYEITRGDGALFAPVTGNVFTNTELKPNTSYTYVVKAYTSTGHLLGESNATATTDEFALAFSAVSNSSTSIDLTYSANGSVDHYLLKRADLTDGQIVPAGGYTDSGLIPNTPYEYTLEAYDATGTLLGQATTSVTTQQLAVEVHAVALDATTVELTYSAEGEVARYVLQRTDGKSINPLPTGGRYVDSGVLPNTAYTYVISAFNSDGHLLGQNTVTITTPEFVLNLTAKTVNATSIELTYNGNGGVAKYVLSRDGEKKAVPAGYYLDSALTPNLTYEYTLEAFDPAGNLLGSTTVNATTLPLDVTVTASASSATSVSLGYGVNGAADYYVIKRGDTVVYEGSASTFQDKGLTPDTLYTYTVEAYNANGHLLGNKTVEVRTVPFVLTLQAKAENLLTVNATFSGNGDVARYVLKRDGKVVYDGSDASYTDHVLLPGTYKYQVEAYDANGTLLGKAEKTVNTLVLPLPLP